MIELLVALMIASIVLAAVATLAGATAAANEATEQMGREQAQLRQLSMRLTELIKWARDITGTEDNGFALWHDLNGDGLETADELTQVFRDGDYNTITIIRNGVSEVYPQCKNVAFKYVLGQSFIAVFFDLEENGAVVRHSVGASLRAPKQ